MFSSNTVDWVLLEQLLFAIVHRNVAEPPVIVTPDAALSGFAIVAEPAMTDQPPVSFAAAAFAASVNEALSQFDWALPASATVGSTFVSVMSDDETQTPFVIVQRNVAEPPVIVTPDVAISGFAIVAEPAMTDQPPVSFVAAAFAASANKELSQFDWAAPASATVGTTFVSVTVEVEVQLPLVMVHLKTAGLVITVTALVLEVDEVMVAAPLPTLHAPVSPVAGAFAAMVKALLLHFV